VWGAADGIAADSIPALRRAGARVFRAERGDAFAVSNDRAVVAAQDPASFRALVALEDASAPTDVAVFWPADHPGSGAHDALERLPLVLSSVLHLTQALLSTSAQPPR